ncbi:MAG: CopG family transcriptional regulator [Spirochaetia bacterium]|nr:CopG family transcriptional regulator [Spirochaetia bacterium]
MSKTISLRVDNTLYQSLKIHAAAENRSISNFIETATKRYIDEVDYVDEFEMESISGNPELVDRLKQGAIDASKGRGRFA